MTTNNNDNNDNNNNNRSTYNHGKAMQQKYLPWEDAAF